MANTPTTNFGILKPAAGDINWDDEYASFADLVDVELMRRSNENLILNGGFQIWQRGTSFVSGNPAVDVADMFVFFRGGFATGGTFSQQPATAGVKGKWVGRMQRDNGNTNVGALLLTHAMESVNSIPHASKQVTLSVQLRKGANYSGANVLIVVETGTGTDQPLRGGVFTGKVTALALGSTLTTSFQKFSITGTLASGISQIGVEISWTPTGTAGANDWIEVGEIKLEEGSVATDFVYPDYGEERTKAQRRYEEGVIGTIIGSEFGYITAVRNSSANNKQAGVSFNFEVTKRAIPVMTYSNTYIFKQTSNVNRWNTSGPARIGVDGVTVSAVDNTNFATGDVVSIGFKWAANSGI